MEFYPTLITLHIIFAGIWLVNFISDKVFRSHISKGNDKKAANKIISLYLIFGNLLGIIGTVGILITGIILVSMNPGYGFFDMSSNHWLATKQIIMVILLILTFSTLIPTAKKIRQNIEKNVEDDAGDDLNTNLKKLYKINTIVNILIIMNLLFALSHRFMG